MCYNFRLFPTFSCLYVIVCFIVIPRGTKDNWVNPLPFFKHNCVKFFYHSLLQYDLDKHLVREIFIRNDKLFFYIVHKFCVLFLFLILWFVDILLKIFHIMATKAFQIILYNQHYLLFRHQCCTQHILSLKFYPLLDHTRCL